MVSIWYGFVCLMISIPLSEAIQCKGSAIYTLTFKAEWTNDSHLDFPPKPHFSRLVGCSHNSSYVMWRPGVNATDGVQDVAELGRNDAINNEMNEQIKLKNALAKYLGPNIRGGTGTAKQAGINVNSQYPLVSVITMIAPSPDWFVGVRDYSLCNETSGKWVEERVKELFPYDSGTDSGPRFRSPNQPTQPHVPIFLITNKEEGSFKSNKPINRFGTFTFEKTFESKPSTTTTNIISPEPTTTRLATAVMTSSVTLLEKLSSSKFKINVEATQGTKIVAMTSPVPLLEKPSSKVNVETTERTTIVAITSSVTLLEKPSSSKVNVEATQRTAPTTPFVTLSGKPSLRKTKVEATQGTKTAPVTPSVTLSGKPSSRKTKVEATQGTKTALVTPSATPLEKSSSSEINVEATQRTTDPVASSVTPSGKPSLKKTKVEATEGTKTPVVTSSVTPSRTQLLPSATMSASGTCSFAYFNIHVFSILIIVSSFIM